MELPATAQPLLAQLVSRTAQRALARQRLAIAEAWLEHTRGIVQQFQQAGAGLLS